VRLVVELVLFLGSATAATYGAIYENTPVLAIGALTLGWFFGVASTEGRRR
jgi:hypothetical protein